MNEHPLTTREYEEDAVRKRLWSHAVGVINSKRVPTAHKGGKWLSEVPGSASAIKWGAHHAVLTAKHLVADLSASDLRLYTRPSGRPELAEYERSGFVPSQLGGQMVLCGWEDLALITLPANSSDLKKHALG